MYVKKLSQKSVMLSLSLTFVWLVSIICSPNSNAGLFDRMSSYASFTVGDVVTVRRSPRCSVYRRDVEVEIEPSLIVDYSNINGNCCTQKERLAILVRKLLVGPDFNGVTSVKFSSELPPPWSIKNGYSFRDILRGRIVDVSVMSDGESAVVTFQPDCETLC